MRKLCRSRIAHFSAIFRGLHAAGYKTVASGANSVATVLVGAILIHIMRMLHWRIVAAAILSIAALSGTAMTATITKESLPIDRDKRPYYLHAGGPYPNAADRQQLFAAPRKIPIAMFHGVNDQTISVGTAREARDALTAHGFPVTLTEIAGHDHNYYRRAEEINREAWAFLKDQALEKDPQYQFYAPARKGGNLSPARDYALK